MASLIEPETNTDVSMEKGPALEPQSPNAKKIEDGWIETKKEFEIDNEGNYIHKKSSVELKGLRKKEYLDFVFRIIGLAAIFIPLVLFFFQQKNEAQRQKRLFEIESYSNAITSIQLMLHKSVNDKDFIVAKDELYYKLFPKIKFINDSVITQKC